MGNVESTPGEEQRQKTLALHNEVTKANGQSIPLENQSYIVPNSANPETGSGPIYRSRAGSEKLIDKYWPEVTTVYEAFQRGVKNYAQNPCIGSRFREDGTIGGYTWETYSTISNAFHGFGSALITEFDHKPNDHIGIYAINRREWVIAEQACYSQSLVTVALYDTLGPDAVAYVINHAELKTIVCTKDKISKILEVADKCPTVKNIIQMEPQGDKTLIDAAAAKGIRVVSFPEVLTKGLFQTIPPTLPTPDDVATIMYTSGTTGVPKGVLLTHYNIIATVAGVITQGILIYPDDIHISYLPMAHIFERAIQVAFFGSGGAIGFYQGDTLKLFDDIQLLQPTIFVSVPRLFNRLFDKVNQGLKEKGAFSQFLFNMGYSSKKSSVDEGSAPESFIWDRVLFSKIKEKLGRVRLIVSGSAPLSREVFQFLQICFCCPVLQGYGLTETGAGGTITLLHDFAAHGGPPVACLEIKLVDVPDMKYTNADKPNPRGEICLRGPNIFKGYYKDDEKTKEAIDEEGWFHTGDIGMWHPNGTLAIIDRKKNMFKLSQGEYIAVEYVEGIYQKNQYIAQIFVYGDSYQSVLVAVVVPDKDVLIPWAKAQNKDTSNFAELLKDPDVKKEILQDMTKTGKDNKLKGFEFVKAIHLESEPFTIEANLMTPTFKLRRSDLKEHYQTVIDDLYASVKETSA